MMKMTFDKGLSTERSLAINHLSERPITHAMNGTLSIESPGDNDIPDVSPFLDNPNFSTVEVLDENMTPYPICEGYNVITDLATNYDDMRKIFSLSVMVGRNIVPE